MREDTENVALSPEEAALYLHISEKTLANMRMQGRGPVFFKPTNKLIYYYKKDLDKWIKDN